MISQITGLIRIIISNVLTDIAEELVSNTEDFDKPLNKEKLCHALIKVAKEQTRKGKEEPKTKQ